MPSGGGSHVDELLDVPSLRLRPVGGDVEAPGHPGRIARGLRRGAPGRGTSRCAPGPRGARARRRRGRAGRSSGRRGGAGRSETISRERRRPASRVRPVRRRRWCRSAGGGCAARSSRCPPPVRHRPAAAASGRPSRWATSSLAGPSPASAAASSPAAKAVTRPSVAPPATRASCAAAWARLRPAGLGGVGQRRPAAGPGGPGGVVGHGAHPGGVGVELRRRSRGGPRAPAPSPRPGRWSSMPHSAS